VPLRQPQQVVGLRRLGQDDRVHAAVQQGIDGAVQRGGFRCAEAPGHGAFQGSFDHQVIALVFRDY
jgi:hypothetical protein